MTHGSLFSGGGGFDIAAETLGWRNIFHCETDRFCKRILAHHWPGAYSFNDIRDFNATKFKGKIDVLSGGFPCQPFSLAGKRNGTSDNRYLWPEMLRIIRQIRPTWVVAENVYGILNWNEGLVFNKVHTDLEAAGYEVQTFILPACGVNAPHRRNRVWFIAHTAKPPQRKKEYPAHFQWKEAASIQREDIQPKYCRIGVPSNAPYPTVMDSTNATAKMKSSQVKPGSMHSVTLTRWASLIPTATARDWKGARTAKTLKKAGRRSSNSLPDCVAAATGENGQLNPLFVEEMMGFPRYWTALPFQNGERKH